MKKLLRSGDVIEAGDPPGGCGYPDPARPRLCRSLLANFPTGATVVAVEPSGTELGQSRVGFLEHRCAGCGRVYVMALERDEAA